MPGEEIERFRLHLTYGQQVSFGGIWSYLDKISAIGVLPSG